MKLYWRFTLFLLPLVVTIFVQEISVQWITGGLARLPMSIEALAAFGLAFGLSSFLTGPLVYSKQMSMVLVERRQSFRTALGFMLVVIGLIMGLQALLASPGPGRLLILNLHHISLATAQGAQTILLWLLLHPLLKGMSFFLAGPLIRNHLTRYVSFASVSGFVALALTVAILLQLPGLPAPSTLLPVAALYAGQVCELLIIGFGVLRHRETIWNTRLHVRSETRNLTLMGVFRFFWPLAGIVLMQEFSRPLINLVTARQPDGELALAVLAVVYALGQWPYRWLNETRTLAVSFLHADPRFRAIRRFNAVAGLVSLSISLLLFWTPVRTWMLVSVLGVDQEFAVLCHVPLMVFSGFSLVVTVRSYIQGLGLVERRTAAMVPSAPTRVAAIILALLLLPLFGVQGATMGVTALLCGFAVETLTLVVMLRGSAWHRPGPPAQPGSRQDRD